jgi:hypothetical protein
MVKVKRYAFQGANAAVGFRDAAKVIDWRESQAQCSLSEDLRAPRPTMGRARAEHIRNQHEGFMRRFVVLLPIGLLLASCNPEGDVTGSTNNCATNLYPSFNPKVREQCVNVCTKCEHGNTVTCSTSCFLKGAR